MALALLVVSAMRSTAHLQGHPVHPMLIPFPFAFLLGSAALSTAARLRPGSGLNRTASLIAEARAENPNSILVDAGDLLQGSPMGDVVARVQPLKEGEVHPAYAIMNLLKYDAAAIGNHEFNFGLDILERAQIGRGFPILAANAYRLNADGTPGENLFPPSILLTRSFKDETGAEREVKIGVIGVLPPQIMNWDKDKLTGKLTTGDAVEAVEREIPKLKEQGADIIVVLAHAGISAQPRQGMDENFAYYLAKVPGVDAVVTGHSHRVFPGKDYESLPGADLSRGTIDGKPYVMAGSFGSHLGVIDILLDDSSGRWSVKDSHAEARPVASKNDDGKMVARLPADPAVTALVKPWTEATLAYIRAPIGEAKGPFNTYLALLGDTAALRLVADAQRAYAEKLVKGTPYEGLPLLSAAAPFRVGGRPGPDYYTDVKAGPIAIKDAADLYIYPNMLTVVKLKGSEVREYLEKAARIFNQIDPAKAEPQQLIANMPAYNFDILFGLTYTIDVTKPGKIRLTLRPGPKGSYWLDGQPLETKPVSDEESVADIDLKEGKHTLLVRVDLSKVPNILRLRAYSLGDEVVFELEKP